MLIWGKGNILDLVIVMDARHCGHCDRNWMWPLNLVEWLIESGCKSIVPNFRPVQYYTDTGVAPGSRVQPARR